MKASWMMVCATVLTALVVMSWASRAPGHAHPPDIASGEVQVNALDADGKPAKARSVRLFVVRNGKRQLVAQDVTDDEGHCFFHSIPAKEKYVIVLNHGKRSVEDDCEVVAEQVSEVTLNEKK